MNNHNDLSSYISNLASRLNLYYQNPVLSEQYAWWTIETITGKTRSQLLAAHSFELSQEQETQVEEWVHALTHEHTPIQYLIGHVPFCDLTITVQKPTLIPRPETENWCADIIKLCKLYTGVRSLRILDLCSGTGCIGLACAQALPTAQVVCVDIRPEALELGRLNAQRNGIKNVTFIESDLFEQLAGMQFELILTNPPYISETEFLALDASVTAWEDKKALVAEDAGYALIKKIINQAAVYIHHDEQLELLNVPQLVIEHGAKQSAQIVDLMRNAGYIHVQAHKDLSDKDRVVCGRLPYVVATKKTA